MPPPTDQQNGVIQRYVVNVTSGGTGEQLLLHSSNSSISVHNLHPFTTYYCSVAAETVAVGPFSLSVQVITPEDGMLALT